MLLLARYGYRRVGDCRNVRGALRTVNAECALGGGCGCPGWCVGGQIEM